MQGLEDRAMKLGMAVLRMIAGTLFVGHGLQKLTGWFGGHGLRATGEAFEGMGLRPGKPHAAAAGLAETVGGGLLCAGLLTPLGASMVTGSMAVAIYKVHAKNGVWVSEGGFEYNLVLAAVAFACAAEGPGAFSLDERLDIRMAGLGFALGELAAALTGAALVVARPQPASGGSDPRENGAQGLAHEDAESVSATA
jgi:putative oxidoreductase